ncbi:MAG TPA: hypothetical protein VF121_15885 [Thermoanaerobaculia bacterium]|nr:hypothetical protein [Thermoanaerobaculia bacterium]
MTRLLQVCCALGLLAVPAAAAETAYSVKSDGDDALYTIDLYSGRTRRIGATGFGDVESLAFSPGCATLYGVDDVKDVLVRCALATGACTQIGPLRVDVTDTGLAFAADGKLYMSTDAPKPPRLYQIDVPSGRADLLGEQKTEITGLTGGPPTKTCRSGLYGLGGDSDPAKNKLSQLYCLDPDSGAATALGKLQTVNPVDGGIEFGASGVLWGLDDEGTIFWLNTLSGRAAVVVRADPARRGFEGLAIDGGVCAGPQAQSPLEIPAAGPAAFAALAAALGGLGARLLRRRASSEPGR